MKASYLVWRVENKFRYKIGKETHEVPWSMQRERELAMLLARWDEERPDHEPGWKSKIERLDAEEGEEW